MTGRVLRITFRMYVAGQLRSEERFEESEEAMAAILQKFGERYAQLSQLSDAQPTMLELEFHDEVRAAERFLRIGTDPNGMVHPVAMDLQRPN